MTDHAEAQARGDDAAMLLNHPLMQEFFEKAESLVIETWKNSDIDDEKGHQRCKIALRCQQNLKEQFVKAIANGKIAANELLLVKDQTTPIRQQI